MTLLTQASVQRVVNIAEQAGRAILAVYHADDFQVQEKSDESPVTAADLAADAVIQRELAKYWPEIPVLSEEQATVPYAERQTWQHYWLVDPLDGTREFIKRNGEFTVNIALVVEHRARLGVIHCPVTGETYTGLLPLHEEGEARCQRDGHVNRLSVDHAATGPLRLVVSRNNPPALDALLAVEPVYERVSRGSSLKFCLVAEGVADVYPRLHPCCEWDTAAGQAILEAAGGQLLDLDGQPLRYNLKDDYLNPYFVAFGSTRQAWPSLLKPT